MQRHPMVKVFVLPASSDSRLMAKNIFSLARSSCVALLVMCGAANSASITRTSAFDYDPSSGLLTKEMVEPGDSSLCVVTHHVRDSLGRIQSTTLRTCNGSAAAIAGGTQEAPAPGVSASAYAAPRQTSFTFTADGRFVTTTTNAVGHVERVQYHPTFGVGTSVQDLNGLTTEWAYDAFGRKVLQKNADGTGILWIYQYCSSLPGGTDTNCPTIAGAQGAFSVTETPVRGPIDLVAQTTGAPNGPYSKKYFDTLSREIRSETQGSDAGMSSRLVFVDTEYDGFGNAVGKSRPYYQGDSIVWTRSTYDIMGRVQSVSEVTAAGVSTHTFLYNGLITSSTKPLSGTTTEVRDLAGRVATVTDALGAALAFEYDPLGNLVKTTDARGNVTTVQYDVRGRRVGLNDPDMGVWSYQYNVFGDLVWQRDAKQQVATTSYDGLSRITRRSEGTQNSAWYFDRYADGSTCAMGRGKLCEANSTNGFVRRHAYDTLGRLSSTSTTVEGVFVANVSYSGTTGRVSTKTYPGGMQLRYEYTDAGLGYLNRVVDVRTGVALWTAGPSAADGRHLSYSYGNGLVTSNLYYPDGKINSTHAVRSGGSASHILAHTYDLAGRITSRADLVSGVTATYGYDALGRLLTESRSGGALASAQSMAWAYDSIGNMTSRTERGTTNVYNYPASGPSSVRPHAVVSVTGDVNGFSQPTYAYDANGNLTTGAGRTVAWTSFNKVQRIARGSNELSYAYDVDHERATEYLRVNGALQRTTVYLNPAAGAGLYFEQETGSGGLKRKHFVTAAGLPIGVAEFNGSTWSMRYWHLDHLGSVSAVTDEAGNVVERLSYEPYGKRRHSNGVADPNAALRGVTTDRGFTGHEHIDEVALVNMNGRVFDPGLGRFLSADPFIQSPHVLQSYNRYSYVWNRPLNSVDPSGYVSLQNEWRNLYHNQTVQTIVTAVIAYYCSPCAAAYTAGRVAYDTRSVEQGLKAGVTSFATQIAFNYVGDVTGFHNVTAASFMTESHIANMVGHAAVGCLSAVASGGKCGQGAAGAALGSFATPLVAGAGDWGVVPASIAGGIGSKLAGGKFESGALTGAFGYLFNELAGSTSCLQRGFCSKVYRDGTVCPAGKACYNPLGVDQSGAFVGITLEASTFVIDYSLSVDANGRGYLSFGRGLFPGGSVSVGLKAHFAPEAWNSEQIHNFFDGMSAVVSGRVGPVTVGKSYSPVAGTSRFVSTTDFGFTMSSNPAGGLNASVGASKCIWLCSK